MPTPTRKYVKLILFLCYAFFLYSIAGFIIFGFYQNGGEITVNNVQQQVDPLKASLIVITITTVLLLLFTWLGYRFLVFYYNLFLELLVWLGVEKAKEHKIIK